MNTKKHGFKKGVRVWTCDGCGKQETWRKGWAWLFGVESPTNKHPDGLIYPLSFCSDACELPALEKAMAA